MKAEIYQALVATLYTEVTKRLPMTMYQFENIMEDYDITWRYMNKPVNYDFQEGRWNVNVWGESTVIGIDIETINYTSLKTYRETTNKI